MRRLNSLTEEERKAFIASIDTVVTDCDGAIWLSGRALPGATQVMNSFAEKGRKTFFVTNNSKQTRSEFVAKCNKLGFKATKEQIIGTAYLTAHYLKSKNFNKKVYVMGSKAIQTELKLVGIEGVGVGPDHDNPNKMDVAAMNKQMNEIGAVIVGYDMYICLAKMIKACTYLKDPNIIFIGTNLDEQFPHDSGKYVIPGTGTMVRAIETGSMRKPIIMGKPAMYSIEGLLKPQGMVPSRSLMIGDKCDTDIQFGNEAGMTTLLVLTGVTSKDQLDEIVANGQKHLIPTYYAESVEELVPFLKYLE